MKKALVSLLATAAVTSASCGGTEHTGNSLVNTLASQRQGVAVPEYHQPGFFAEDVIPYIFERKEVFVREFAGESEARGQYFIIMDVDANGSADFVLRNKSKEERKGEDKMSQGSHNIWFTSEEYRGIERVLGHGVTENTGVMSPELQGQADAHLEGKKVKSNPYQVLTFADGTASKVPQFGDPTKVNYLDREPSLRGPFLVYNLDPTAGADAIVRLYTNHEGGEIAFVSGEYGALSSIGEFEAGKRTRVMDEGLQREADTIISPDKRAMLSVKK